MTLHSAVFDEYGRKIQLEFAMYGFEMKFTTELYHHLMQP